MVNELFEPAYDPYAALAHFNDALAMVTKALEGYDHIEDIDYRTVIQETLIVLVQTTLVLYTFGPQGIRTNTHDFKTSVQQLVVEWYCNLMAIKKRHCFYDYFEAEHYKNKTICKIHRAFIGVS